MIIGFSGKMGAGKSTAAYLVGRVSYQPVRLIKFAQPLYDMQTAIYDRIKGVHIKPDAFVKDRVLLQLLGTEWGRNSISPTLWTDLWASEAKLAVSKGFNVVCDDVRFENEALTIKALGGVIVDVSTNRIGDDSLKGLPNHPSELGLPRRLIDVEVTNNGTEGQFQLSLVGEACLSDFFRERRK